MIKDGQVRSLRRWLDEGCTLREAARRCGMDEKTARRYRKSGMVPTPRGPRSWRTRPDVFADVWPQVQARLESDSKLQAVTLFRELMREHPERFQECHRRTFERRVNQWRATTGPARSVFFDQVHRPGRLASFDFTEVASLDITIQRTPFPHLLFHAVLTHSNVESVRICFSESFEALSAGLQAAFHEWGGVPERVRSDSLSAAVNNLSETREFRERYQALLAHYDLAGERINVRCAHENGDVEASHGHFKTALDQQLRLRGSRDFASREEYDQFLQGVREGRNLARRAARDGELPRLRPLPATRFDAPVKLAATVSSSSTIQVRSNTYSVHSRLIGKTLQVALREAELELYLGTQLVDTLPRLCGRQQAAINYRHVIDSLRRKPGAFANYRYREELFPSTRFRLAYDELSGRSNERAASKEYLEILYLAATDGEELVDGALARLALDPSVPLSAAAVKRLVHDQRRWEPLTVVHVDQVDLTVFDALLEHMEVFDVRDYAEEESSRAAETGGVIGSAVSPSVESVERVDASAAAATEDAASADVPRALPELGRDGAAGDLELPAVPGGVDAARVSSAGSTADRAPVGGVEVAAGEDVGAVRLEATAGESGATSAGPAGWRVPGASDQRAALRSPGLGEDACVGGAGGAVGPPRAERVVHLVQPAGAGPAGGETRSETASAHQASAGVRGVDHRRLGLCATEPRGDGSAVHPAGRTVRADERALEQQSTVLAVGADLPRPDDHGGRHRSLGASQRDRGTQHPQLSLGRGETRPEWIAHDHDRLEHGGFLNFIEGNCNCR